MTFGKQTPHHIKNTKDFVNEIHCIQLQLGKYVSSYGVSALFTSEQTDPAFNIIGRN